VTIGEKMVIGIMSGTAVSLLSHGIEHCS